MQRFLLVLMLAGAWNYSCAQDFIFTGEENDISNPVLLKSVPSKIYSNAKPPGLRMRNTGRTLTLCGGALAIGGIIMMNNADQLYYTTTSTQNGTIEEGDPRGALGVLMTVAGVGMAVPGIIFWSKGQKKYNRYLEQQKISVHSKVSGLTLCYSF